MWSNQKKKKIHVFTVVTILTLQFMFLMALCQNAITAIHRVPKRKNTQLIILWRDQRIQWHFCSKKRWKKKKSNFYVSELRLVTLIMLYLKPWRVLFGDLALLVSVCIINKLMPFTFTWAAGGGGTRGLVLLDSPEVKNFNKIMALFGLAWTDGLHHGMVVIWSIQSASLRYKCVVFIGRDGNS